MANANANANAKDLDAECVRGLRQRLAARLRALIRNPVIEAKELAAFDLIMSRRQFLKASQLAGVTALVAAGVPPTVWARARKDHDLKVCPQDVGLTDGEQASVGVAAQLVVGTELFQDTIYAQPVVAADQVGRHAVVEGLRARSRVQSSLLSDEPDEFQFLDGQYHLGLPELVQLEQDPVDGIALVHYRHPFVARGDGARTDGLVRSVLLSVKEYDFYHPTGVLAVTGGNTNRFVTNDLGLHLNAARYMVYVDGDSDDDRQFLIGYGAVSVSPPYGQPSEEYPVEWYRAFPADFLSEEFFPAPVDPGGYRFADTLSGSAWQSPADDTSPEFVPERQAQHIVLTYSKGFAICTLQDPPPQRDVGFLVTWVPKPAGSPDLRVVHIDYDPTASDKNALVNVVLAGNETAPNGDVTYHLYTINHQGNTVSSATDLPVYGDRGIVVWSYLDVLADNFQHRQTTIPSKVVNQGEFQLDYGTIRNVKGLHTTWVDGNFFHVKLASFGDRGVCLFGITKEGPPDEVSTPSPFFPGGFFPLAVPDAAGIGSIAHLSGGTNKFGGFRFMACDSNANLFLFRQRSAEDADTPYKPPIYAQYAATGGPQTSWSRDPLPLTGISSASNLQTLQAWVDASAPGLPYVYNFLADAALAFATDDTSTSQAVWLGNSYQAAYALDRFSLDSAHVAIQRAQGSTDTYNAYAVFKEPVTRTWRQRLIATQVDPQGPGLQQSGDHYQAIVTPANAYGKPVSLLASENQNLLIEVQADSPCTVIDDTNNLYYDVDRYTSFMSAPDPANGRLSLLVKADVFSQVLYVRLIDGSALQPSSDPALLSSTAETVYPWQSANLALQAQQRMGNGAPPSSLLGDDMPIADTTVYVSSDTLAASNQATPWQTKGGYQPSSANLSSVADYLNSSGQNLISATGQLSLGAPNANGAIDPLYAVTSVPKDPERDTVTTAFGYAAGEVTTTREAPSLVLNGEQASIWGSISHALHDALHWLQNVEGEVYKDLGEGAVTMVSAVDGITATVSKEIMKQVNGVEQDLEEVVSTVEEYASVVAKVIVTIVEQSFIVKYFELLIALISLFLHFKDLLALSKSMRQFFDGLFDGSGSISLPQVPSSFSSASVAAPFLGPGNNLSSSLQGVDSSNLATGLLTTIADGVLENPLTKKILNKAVSLVSQILDELSPPLPFSFSLDQDAAADAITQIEDLTEKLAEAVAGMSADVALQLVDDLVGDLANPQSAYETLGAQLGSVVEGVAQELLDDMFALVDQIGREGPGLAHELISSDPYITIDTAVLSDLCKLFGLGSVVGSKLQLSSAEAMFFPLAAIAWVAVYMQEGKSIKSVEDLQGTLSVAMGELGSVDTTRWNYIRIVTDFALQELIGLIWLVRATSSSEQQNSGALKDFLEIGSWFGVARWTNDLAFTAYKWSQSSPTPVQQFDYVVVAVRLYTAVADAALNLSGANRGGGWKVGQPKPTDITQLINTILQTVGMGVDTISGAETGTNIATLVGQDVFRTQLLFLFLYNIFSVESEGALEGFLLCVFGTPVIGLLMQMIGLGIASPPPETGGGRPGHCHGGRGTHHGRKRRRRPHGRPESPKHGRR